MTLIFWQNILSIHQSAFLRSLAETHHVLLIVEKGITTERLQHGWTIPDFGKVEVIILPDEKQINVLLEKEQAIHVFSGVQAFKLPSTVFKQAIKKNLFVAILSEPFNWFGVKGKLRFLKYFLFSLKYRSKIHFILAIGNRGRWCFEKTKFIKKRIYDWAYFTEVPNVFLRENKNDHIKLLFVGSIDKRKNILSLISACKECNIINNLQIVGTGSLEKDLLQAIQYTNCKYFGKKTNNEVQQIMVNTDVLILPSIFDGWGAVVNEALMCGIPVIASENCGSSILLHGIRGCVFSIEKNDLEKVLQKFIVNLPYDIEQCEEIRNWALQNISGEIAAKYFIDIIKHVNKETSQHPIAPWLR